MTAQQINIGYVEGDGRYWLDVTIDGTDHDLGNYATANECGEAMVKWLSDRNLTTAPGSAQRLAEAQRLNAMVVSFDVCTRDEYNALTHEARTASERL